MRSELTWFNELDREDQEIMRRHFLAIRANSQWYENLYDAIKGSVDWEKISVDSVEYFFFHNLLNEAEELKKNEKIS